MHINAITDLTHLALTAAVVVGSKRCNYKICLDTQLHIYPHVFCVMCARVNGFFRALYKVIKEKHD